MVYTYQPLELTHILGFFCVLGIDLHNVALILYVMVVLIHRGMSGTLSTGLLETGRLQH